MIRKPHQRRAGLRRGLGQPDDGGIGAAGRPGAGAHAKGAAGIDGTAAQPCPLVQRNGQWFAGKHAFIKRRAGIFQSAIGGHGFSGADQQQVIRRDGIQRDFADFAIADARRTARGTCQKFGQRPFRAALGPGFQSLATCHHQRDHRGGGGFIQRQRAQDGEKRNDIHAKPPTQKRADDPNRHMQRDRQGSRCPGDSGIGRITRNLQRNAGGKPKQHPSQHQPRGVHGMARGGLFTHGPQFSVSMHIS